jgi:hypothetical protein
LIGIEILISALWSVRLMPVFGTLIPKLPTINRDTFHLALFAEMKHWYRGQVGTPQQYKTIADEIGWPWCEFQRVTDVLPK